MVVAVTLDPAAFDSDAFDKDERYGQILREIFRKLGKNGVILVDSDGVILKRTAKNIEKLSTVYANKIRIVLEEILKSKKKRVFSVDNTDKGNTLDKCTHTTNNSRSEAVVTKPDRKEDYLGKIKSEVITYNNYYESRLFSEIAKFTEGQIHTENIDKDEFDRIFSKFTFFSEKLFFYDKQIGSGDNIEGLKRGIEYIVNIWENSSNKNEQKKVKIYTCAKERVSRSEEADIFEDLILENQKKMSEINEKIVSHLESKYNVDVSVVMKVDKHSRLHARYLSNGEFHIHMERGFDFLRYGGEDSNLKLRSFPFTLSPGAEEYLGAYQMAPDAALTT